jgi:ribulose-phosphate 3-epimerase
VRAIWHAEIKTDHAAVIKACSELGWECGLALSPETSPDTLAPFAGSLDEVLVLGVHPGYSGQTLIPSTIQKARDAKHQFPFLLLGFDGGVSVENVDELISAGVDRVCIASAVFQQPDPQAALRAILTHV